MLHWPCDQKAHEQKSSHTGEEKAAPCVVPVCSYVIPNDISNDSWVDGLVCGDFVLFCQELPSPSCLGQRLYVNPTSASCALVGTRAAHLPHIFDIIMPNEAPEAHYSDSGGSRQATDTSHMLRYGRQRC